MYARFVLVLVVRRRRQGTRLAALLPQDILETFRDKSTPGPRGKEVSKEAFDEGMQVGRGSPTTTERIESNRIESNRIESNRIESNRIESNRIESNRIESNRIESNRIESRE